jgi:transposase-like protein
MHYHRNAKTNVCQRQAIKESSESARKLAEIYHVSPVTTAKWRKADHIEDKSHRPENIHYAVPPEFWKIIKKTREKTKLPIDDLLYQLVNYVPNLKRGNLYRILCHYQLNKLTEKERREIKKFKKYPPGYLHIDCFYLPKFNGKRWYCYLAVDRATRLLFLKVYPRKNKYSAGDFLMHALGFYPFRIHTILTDNGAEFSNLGTTGFYGRKLESPVPFELICDLTEINYRKTKYHHPWTNGMAERMVRTVKDHTLKLERYETQEEAIVSILQFPDTHNFKSRLRVLGFKTPYQITLEWFIKEPKLFIKNPNEMLTIR